MYEKILKFATASIALGFAGLWLFVCVMLVLTGTGAVK